MLIILSSDRLNSVVPGQTMTLRVIEKNRFLDVFPFEDFYVMP